jgi:undecaprenyl diphosphate synthase
VGCPYGKKAREQELLEVIDPEKIPFHVAIIMDGNGRWAVEKGCPGMKGIARG